MLKTGLVISAVALIAMCASSSFAFDDNLPTIDPANVPDNVLITYDTPNPVNATQMTINAPDKTIMNFSSFNISNNYSVNVVLPTYDNGSLASFLARDVGGNASNINGILNCNGLFILTNTNGINVGSTGQINAASLILSTRDITNSNFLSANYVFEKQLSSQTDRLLLNRGTITISQGGFGVLIAGAIENQGLIVCPMGTVALAGGDLVRLDISANKLISIAIDEETASDIYDYNGNRITDQIKNSGSLIANGGTVILRAESLPGIFEKAINMTGYIKADRVDSTGGVVKLISSGSIEISGEISATQIEIGQEATPPANVNMTGGVILAGEESVKVAADRITVNTASPVVEISKTSGDIHVNNSQNVENLITIEGDGLKVTYMVTSDFTLKTEGTVDTTPGAILYGNNITLIARQFGNTVTPLNIDSPNIHIKRTLGDIDILESTGIGTSVQITGPPDGFGKIIYPKTSSLKLEATRTTLSTDTNPSYLFGNITFYNFECTAPGKTIYFEAGKTYTFLGNTEIVGAEGFSKIIKLYSSQPGSPWYIKIPSDTYKIAYIAVQDSYSIGNNPIVAKPKTDFGGNTGWAENDTVYISSWEELANMSQHLDWDYILNADLSSGYGNWTPIGDSGSPFIGTFDGNGHTISGLSIDTSVSADKQYVGLFGYTDGATLSNIGITNATINASYAGTLYVGSLVGYCNNTSITNSYATGTVTATAGVSGVVFAGGLVGRFMSLSGSATISNSYATVTVTATAGASGTSYVGGLVGRTYNSSGTLTISNSYATGTITAIAGDSGSAYAGGLVGCSEGYATDTISNSYATGFATATAGTSGYSYAGGLVGRMFEYGTATISNSYATGAATATVTSGSTYAGGLVGHIWKWSGATQTISNSFATGVAAASGGSANVKGGLIGDNSDSGATITNCKWYNATNTNGIGNPADGTAQRASGYSYFYDKDNAPLSSWTWNSSNWTETVDSDGDPLYYPSLPLSPVFTEILDEGDLQAVHESDLGGYYYLGDDIVLTTEFTSYIIGTYDVDHPEYAFSGVFLGQGHTISDLAISNTSYSGLFGYTSGATLFGIQLLNVNNQTSSGYYVGGLVGYNDSSSIINCYVMGRVSGYGYTGGVAGYNEGGVIANSFSTANVTGNGDSTGGLVGYNDSGTIVNSYATGDVSNQSTNNYLGGLVGYNNAGTITNSYATGDVSGSSLYKLGGLVGYNIGTITNSYATGSVGGYADVGGLVGYNGGTITYSFATGIATAAGDTPGGLIGDGSNNVSNCKWYNPTNTDGIGSDHDGYNLRASGYAWFYSSGNAPLSSWTFDSSNWLALSSAYPLLAMECNIWAASGSGNWSTAGNWSKGVVPTAGTTVLFNATSIQTSSVDASFAGSIGKLYIDTGYSGVINQGVAININGVCIVSSGTLTLSQANTITGGLTLNAGGTLNINHATGIGSGTLTINGGTIDNSSSGSITLTNNNPQVWNGSFVFTGTNNLNMGTGNVTLGADTTITISANTLRVDGVISGANSLGEAGSGYLTLSGTNTFGGAGKNFTLTAGTLNLNNSQALGNASTTFIINGGTIVNETDASLTINYAQVWGNSFTVSYEPLKGWYVPLNFGTSAVTLTSDVTITVNVATYNTNTHLLVGGVISGNYNLTKAGGGMLTLSGANNFGGSGKSFTLSAGYLYLNNASALGNANNAFVLDTVYSVSIGNTSGAAITLNNYAMTWSSQNVYFYGPYDLNLGAGAVTMTRDVTLTSYTPTWFGIPPENYAVYTTVSNLTIGGIISGAYNLSANGYAAVTLSGANTFGGAGKSFTLQGGILNINNASALGNSSNTFTVSLSSNLCVIDNTSGEAITLNNYAQTWSNNFTFTGTNDLNLGAGAVSMSSSMTVTVNGGTLTVGGIISGASKSLTKAGTGTLTLTGLSTFSGGSGVVVNGGKLLLDLSINTTGVLVNTNALTLAGGTLEVKGKTTGTSSQTLGNLTINAGAGSIILDANGGTGTSLTLGNTWTRNAGGTLLVDISGSGTGTLTSSPTLTNSVLGYAVVKDATTYGFATVTGGKVVRYTGASALANNSDSSTTNFSASGNLTMTTASHATNSLSIDTTGGGTLDLGGASDVLSFTSGGILLTGTGDYTIQTGQLGANAAYLVINHFGSGTLTISATLGTGAASITKAGTGTALLSSANTYTGVTAIGAGILKAGAPNVFGGASSTSALTINGGTLDMNGYSQAFGSLTGYNGTITSGSSGAVTLTIGNDGTSPAVYNGIIQNGSGTVSVTKVGSGALTLGGNNTYSGNTTLSVGTLGINYYKALGTSTFIVNSGTTINGMPNGTSLISTILNNVQWNGSITFGNSISFGGNVAMGSDVTLSGSTTIPVYGVISGPYNLTISGLYVNVYNANTFGGVGKTITVNNNSSIRAYNNSAFGDTNNTLILNTGSNGNIVGNTGVLYTITLNQIQWNVSAFYTEGRFAIYNAPIILGTDVAINNGYTSDRLTYNGIISGPYSITLNAYTSYVTLNSANTFGGSGKGFTLTAGTVNINNASAFGNAANTLTVNGGTINNTSGAAITLADNHPQTWGGSFTFTGTNNLNMGTGAVTMNGNRTVTVSAGNLTVGGITGGGFNITKAGAGTLTLAAANTCSGTTTISAGTLKAGAQNVLGGASSTQALIMTGGTLDLGGYNQDLGSLNGTTGTITSNGGSTATLTIGYDTTTPSIYSGTIQNGTGTVAIAKAGSGALALSGANTYSGGTTLSAGTLNIGSATAIGTGRLTIGGGIIDNTSGGSLALSNNNAQTWNGSFVFTGTDNLNMGTGNVTLGADTTITINANTLRVDGVISGANSLAKDGTGALTLSGTNTFGGAGKNFTLTAGTFNINNAQAIGGAGTTFIINGGTIINLTAASLTFANNYAQTWGGSFIISYDPLTNGAYAPLNFGTGAVTLTNDVTITTNSSTHLLVGGVISGNYNLTKSGSYRLTLSGTNTFGGPGKSFTFAQGYLYLNNASALGDPNNTFVISGSTCTLGNTSGGPITLNNYAVTLSGSTLNFVGPYDLNLGIGNVTLNANFKISAISPLPGGINLPWENNTTPLVTTPVNLTVGGIISGNYNLAIGDNGSSGAVTLSGANTFGGSGKGVTFAGGIFNINNASALGNSSNYFTISSAIGSYPLWLNNTSGAPITTGNYTQTWGQHFTFIGTNDLNLGAGTVTLSTDRVVTINGGTLTVGGIISGLGCRITKEGAGTLTLTGVSTFNGGVVVNGGTLLLDLSTNTTGVIAGTNVLVLGGGILEVKGKTTGTSSQTLGNLTINAGAGSIVLNANSGTGTSLTLGNTWTRYTGGTLFIDISGAGTGVLTSSPTLTNGILGYAVVKSAIPSYNFATVTGGNLVCYAGASPLANNSDSAITNFSTFGNLTMTTASRAINSLLISAFPADSTLDLGGASDVLTITSGGILLTGSANYTIQTGQLGANGAELIIHHFGSGTLTISATLGTGAASITKAGTGTAVLSSANSYTGTTTVGAGTLKAGAANVFGGASSTSALTINGGTLDMNGYSQAFGSLTGSGGIITSGAAGAVTLTIGNDNTSPAVYNGIIQNGSGTISVTKVGSGTLILGGANTYSGNTTLNTGALTINLNTSLGTGTFIQNTGTTFTGNIGVYGAPTSMIQIIPNKVQWNGTIAINNSIYFGDTLAMGSDVTVSGTGLVGVVGVMSGNYNLAYSGLYLRLFGANTFGGAGKTITQGAGGSMQIANDDSIGDPNSTFIINGGSYIINSTRGDDPLKTVNYASIQLNASSIATNNSTYIKINSPVVLGTDVTFNAYTGSLTIFNGVISGPYSFTIGNGGSGYVTLSAANTFGGAGKSFTTSSGSEVININNAQALGNSANTLVINGGVFNNTSGAAITLADNHTQTWGGDFAFTGTNNLNLGTGAVTMSANRTVTVNGGTLAVGGAISGLFSLAKAGSGALTLSGANTFGTTGKNVTLTAGTLNINNATALGVAANTFIINGGTINNTSGAAITLSNNNPQTWGGDFAFRGTNDLNLGTGLVGLGANRIVTVNGGTLTVGGIISGAYNLTKAGAGTLTLSGVNTFGGATKSMTLSAGTLNINNGHAIGETGTTFVINGGKIDNTSGSAVTFTHTYAQTWGGDFTFTGTNDLNLSTGAVALGADRIVTVNNGTLTVGGIISGAYSLRKAGAGALTLSGVNTFGGAGKNMTLTEGTLNIALSHALGEDLTTFIINGGTLSSTVTTLTHNYPQTWGGDFTFSSGTSLNLGTGAVTMTASRTITVLNSGGTLTVGGIISGSGYSLTKAGTGTLTLTGANLFNGPVNFNAGYINATILNNLGAGTALNFAGGGLQFNGVFDPSVRTMTFNAGGATFDTGANSITFANAVGNSGVGGMTKIGSGTLTLSAANTFTGGVTLNAGTLNINNSQALGTVAGTFIINGGTIDNTSGGAITTLNYVQQWNGDFTVVGTMQLNIGTGNVTLGGNRIVTANGGNGLTVGGSIGGGAYGITQAGTGVLILSGANSYTGTTTINSGGILQIGGNNTTGSLSINSPIVNNGTLRFYRTNTITQGTDFASIISGTGAVTQSGSGTLVLNGLNTYTGKTTIRAGTISINSIGNVNGGASAVGNPSNAANGTISIGSNSQAGTLVYTGGAFTTDRVIDLAGTTGGATIDQSGTGLLKFTSNLTATDNGAKTFTLQGSTAGTGEIAGAIVNSTGTTAIIKSGIGTWTLSGNNTYTGKTTISGGTLKISAETGLGANPATFTADQLTLNGGTLQTTAEFSIDDSNRGITLGASGGTFSSDGGTTLTIASTNIITGTGALTKTGSGTLILSGANTYTGLTTVSVGVLNIQNATATGTTDGGVIVSSGAALQMQGGITVGAETLTLNGLGITYDGALRNTGGNNTWQGAIILGSTAMIRANFGSTLTISTGGITGAAQDLLVDAYGDVTISAVIGTTTGALTKGMAGTLTLSGNNTYTGLTTINMGTLKLGAAGDGTNSPLGTIAAGTVVGADTTLDLNGYTLSTAEPLTLNGTGISSGGALMNSGAAATYSGLITLGSTGVSIVGGTGTIALSNAGTITGSGYALTLGGAQGGSITSIIGTVAGTLTKADAGTWTLSGTNTYTGGTTLSAGTLNINSATALGTGTFTINGGIIDNTSTGAITLTNNNAQTWGSSFTFTGTNDLDMGTGAVNMTGSRIVTVNGGTLTVGGIISGSGSNLLNKQGNGALTLSGANTFGGAGGGVVLTAGTLNINNASAIGNSLNIFRILGGTTLNNTSGAAITLSYSYTNQWNGDFIFTGTNDLNLGTGAVAMNASRQVTVSAGTLTVGGVISGAGFNLTKAGNGTLTLNAANTFTGTTTVSAGTLICGINNALASMTVTVSTGATIDLADYIFNTTTTFDIYGTLKLSGGRAVSTPTLYTGSTVEYTGSTYLSANIFTSYYSLVLSGTGIFTSPVNLTIYGNFAHTAGIFSHNNGTVTFAGTNQTISGNTTFYSITKTGTGTLTFAGDSTQTIEGLATFKGNSLTDLLILNKDSTGSYWNINISSDSYNFLYLDVFNSKNTASYTYIYSPSSYITNCLGWQAASRPIPPLPPPTPEKVGRATNENQTIINTVDRSIASPSPSQEARYERIRAAISAYLREFEKEMIPYPIGSLKIVMDGRRIYIAE